MSTAARYSLWLLLPREEKILDDIGRYFDESIRLEELALYDTSGPPAVWRCVERRRFGGADDQ